jgi:uncharacterized protein
MDRTESQIGVDQIVRRIVDAVQPERVIVFGSAARGDAGPDSDLDLLVVKAGAYSTRPMAVRIRRAVGDAGRPVDVVVVRPEDLERFGGTPGLVYRSALREGQIVYERD